MVSKKEPQKFKNHLVLLHFIAAAHYVYAFYFDMVYVHFPADLYPEKHTPFGGKFKYLTVLNVVIFKFNINDFFHWVNLLKLFLA